VTVAASPEWPRAATGTARGDGVDLAYVEVGHRDDPLVLCLHGFPDTPLTFRRLATELAAAGRRVVVPWQRGYPPSQVVDGPYQVAVLARDAVALVRALSPGRPARILGHDWGASATYGAAVLAPDVVERIVALSVPPSPVFRSFLRSSWDQQRASWYQFLFQLEPFAETVVSAGGFAFVERLWRSWSPGWEPEPELVRAAVSSIEAGFPASLTYYRDTWQRARQRPDLAADQQRIMDGPVTVPALVLHGAQDGCILAAAFADAGTYFSGDVRIEVVPGAGHFLHLERHDVVSELVVSFLAA